MMSGTAVAVPHGRWKTDLFDDWWPQYSSRYGRAWHRPDAANRKLWLLVIDENKRDQEQQPHLQRRISHGQHTKKLVVFLIHGAGGRAEQMRPLIDSLLSRGGDDVEEKKEQPSVVLVVPNLLGFGRSAKPVDEAAYATDEYLRDVEALVNEFGCQEADGQNVIIGHSFGSALAMHCVAGARTRYPIARVVLMGTGHQVPPAAKSPLLHCCECFFECIRPLLSKLSAAQMFVDYPLVARESSVTSQNPFHVVLPLGRQLQWPSVDTQSKVAAAVPTLVINGESDPMTTADSARQLHRNFTASAGARPSSVHLVPRCAHNCMLERADAVAQLVLPFVFS